MSIRVALAQQAAHADPADNLARALSAMDRAHAERASVIVFPELGLQRFFPQHERIENAPKLAETVPGPTTEAIAARARKLSLVTILNLYEIDEQGRCYDSSPVIDADGSLLGVTRMVHITDYAGFHERRYYHGGDKGAPIYRTQAGTIGVAICYDRHYPEYMRALGVAGAELVVIPQAGAVGEWPEGLFEAEVRTAAFQNGYFAALSNRAGPEEKLTFAGESFAVDCEGQVLGRAKPLVEDLVVVDMDLAQCATSTARRLFWQDRRPELYAKWLGV